MFAMASGAQPTIECMDREVLEGWLNEGLSLDQMGVLANRDPSTVSYWVKKHGLTANGRAKHGPRTPPSEAELRDLVARDLTLREMAEELDRSVTTVRRWLAKYGVARPRQWRRERARAALAAGKTRISGLCVRHGTQNFLVFADGRTSCARCNVEAVSRRRRRVKQILVDEAGGRCALCGYSRFAGALQFHHRELKEKAFGLSQFGHTIALDRAREEALKCVLLCANCHAEVEGGVASLSR